MAMAGNVPPHLMCFDKQSDLPAARNVHNPSISHLENKLLLIPINFTPKSSHSYLKKGICIMFSGIYHVIPEPSSRLPFFRLSASWEACRTRTARRESQPSGKTETGRRKRGDKNGSLRMSQRGLEIERLGPGVGNHL